MQERIIPNKAVDSFDFGGFGVVWKINGADSGERFSIVHHPIAPKTLAAPLHRHHLEDEYSFVLRGSMGALLGDSTVTASQGDWVFKPRGQWHTFWNNGEEPCEIIEVISPAGFEHYFREFSRVWPDRARATAIRERYQLDMDLESSEAICRRFGLRSPS